MVVDNHGLTLPVALVSGWCIVYQHFRYMAAAALAMQWREFGFLHLVLRLNHPDPYYPSFVRETVLARASQLRA